MSNIDREDKAQVNFKLARDKWQRFQVKCRDNGASASEILNLLVDIYLGEEIDNYQTVLSLGLETKINEVISKYLKSKMDNYIDRYIEKKLVQEIAGIDSNPGTVITKNFSCIENLQDENIVEPENPEYEPSSMTVIIEKKEIIKNQFNESDREFKTARELADFLGCSPAYITTLNRLGDLEKRGWKDSGKRQGKAILYQRVKL